MKLTPTLGGTLSGSLGGVTASHNKGGLYLRRRAIPTNPNTTRQQEVRAVLGSLTQAWNDQLTDAQRQGWRDYAAAVPVQDRIGNTIQLTGQQMYVRSNTPRVQIDDSTLDTVIMTRIDNAPAILNTGEAVGAITRFELTGDATKIHLDVLFAAPASADGAIIFRVGPAVNAGVNHIRNTLQLAAVGGFVTNDEGFASGQIELDDPTKWIANTLPAASQVGARFPLSVRLAFADGRLSQRFQALVALTQEAI